MRNRHIQSRGFTLIELMVTVAVLGVLASVALVGFRQNHRSEQFSRVVEDARGALLIARNAAIDEQTLTDVEISPADIMVSRFDPATGVWQPIWTTTLRTADKRLAEQTVCIYGLVSGVQTPRQAQAVTPPSSCLTDVQVIRFEPDGSFSDPDATFTTRDNMGATLWIADEQIEGTPKLAVIEIFPGGLVRAFEHTQGAQE